jgi:hypothetical protein
VGELERRMERREVEREISDIENAPIVNLVMRGQINRVSET